MANTIAVDKVVVAGKEKRIRYKLTILAGNYTTAVRGTNGGELIDLTKATGIREADQFWGQKGPDRVYLLNGPGGFAAEVLPGADGLHWLLKMYSAPGTEIVNGTAYNAAVTGDLDFLVEATGRVCD